MNKQIFIIGCGMGKEGALTKEAENAIGGCGLLLGAPRLLADVHQPKKECLRNEEILKEIQAASAEKIGVLVSGDTGFFSAAKKLFALLEGYECSVICGVSSLSYFCARLKTSWDDVKAVSLHGRSGVDIVDVILKNERTFLLTDRVNSADAICKALTDGGLGSVFISVGENLSYEDEIITRGTAEQLAKKTFAPLCVMLAERKKESLPIKQKGTKQRNIPRLMIGGVSSSCGKTTVVCALLGELMRRGFKTISFKSGPDYIDPMFHTEIIGAKARNLDLYMGDEQTAARLLAQNAAGQDIAVMEGAMGYYDGLGGKSLKASSYHLAKATQTPAVLTVDCKGMSVSVCAVVEGFLNYQPSGIQGVILNRVSKGMYERMKEMIETQTGVKVYGYLPELNQATLKSRHLGLVTAAEVLDLKEKINLLAETLRSTVDVEGLIALAQTAPPICYEEHTVPHLKQKVKVAIARDNAFCFYYEDSLKLLEKMGIEWAPFRPLEDQALPSGVSGVLLGGGYPELYAEKLAQNKALKSDIRRKLKGNMPCIAECGGFMYLQKTLESTSGKQCEMAGVVDGDCVKTQRLKNFGYVELTASKDGLLHKKGEKTRAHEFHYWQSDDNGADYDAKKPLGGGERQCAVLTDTLYAGFPHLYLAADEAAAWRFAQACAAYAEAGE